MKWYTDEKYNNIKSEIIDKIFNFLTVKYGKEIKFDKNQVATIFNNYLIIAERLKAPYSSVNPAEKTKFLSDIYIKAIYMIIKNVTTEQELSAVKRDINLRDIIWITLSGIYSITSKDYKLFYNPILYTESNAAPVPVPDNTVPVIPADIEEIKPDEITDKKINPLFIAGAAAVVLFFIMGKKK